MTILAVFTALLCAVYAAIKLSRIGKRESTLPPGPPTLPLLGNALDFPRHHIHHKLSAWAKEYGDIYSLKIASGTFVIVSGASAIKDLVDKNSASTSGRPKNYLVDLVTGGMHMGVMDYSDTWRLLRKTVQGLLNQQVSQQHIPVQQAETMQLMHDLLSHPDRFFEHIGRYSASILVSILYGKRCPRYETHEARTFFEMFAAWERIVLPGVQPPIDFIPILKYVPERWASWKEECRQVIRLQKDLYFKLLEEVEDRVAKGIETSCFMDAVLKNKDVSKLSREAIGYFGGTLLDGGVDSSAAFLWSLVLLLVAYPAVQQKAQEELDRVVGSQCLPTLDDYPNLPYIQAVIKEVQRFRPVTPLGVPHATTEDTRCRGYVIPKGATIITNVWGLYHDPELFENPEEFNPDRFIASEHGTKPGVDTRDFRNTFMFGSGRRICPGMHVGNNTAAIATMNLLWGFNFRQGIDPESKALSAVDITNYHEGVALKPYPFQCKITPRSVQHAELVEKAFGEAIESFLPFEERLDDSEKAWIAQNRVLS